LHRLLGSTKILALFLMSILSFSWLTLHFASLHECRKAERLIADLRSFPFATARFAEVRDFTLRHEGMPIQQLS
jgi:hypothetical protein